MGDRLTAANVDETFGAEIFRWSCFLRGDPKPIAAWWVVDSRYIVVWIFLKEL